MTNRKEPLRLIARDLSESLGKLPPQARDLEEAVLGALMLEKNAINEVIEVLKPDDFYLQQHEEVYAAIVSLYTNSKPIDLRTVAHELQTTGKLELVGGKYYLAQLTDAVSSSANIEHHARVIAEMAMKRRLIQAASTIHQNAYEDTSNVFDVLEGTQKALDEIAGRYIRSQARSAREVMDESVKALLLAMKKQGVVGVPTGYTALDRMLGGWREPDLIIVAARPSMGKTAFVGNLARNAAVDFKIPVAIFSLEMSSKQLMDRMLAAESEIDLDKIIHGDLLDHEFTQLVHKTARLSSAPMYIDDTPALTLLEMRAKCRRLVREKGVKMVIVDYLQLMHGERNGNNREQEIASISRTLKGIAKELQIPVIALSQLSRGVETRGGDKRPMLADLRESGAIEQDADIVIFLYRAEYYKILVYEDGLPTAGTMEAIIAKNRNGRCDTVMLRFIGRHSKVKDFDSFDAPTTQMALIPMKEAVAKSYKDFQTGRRELIDDDPEPTDGLPF